MKIKLNHDWMGHKKNSKLDLTKTAALRLIHLGTAELIKKEGGAAKDIDSPPKDKMVKRPVRKK